MLIITFNSVAKQMVFTRQYRPITVLFLIASRIIDFSLHKDWCIMTDK